eukprot:CAMPEP_0185916188 /NCGR_PEP_ID=MMETSP0924C-20121207/3164_1 /TAXON_ID=321610 /ORGANISM="Perkinsus chesapeaki, Strain ATCC PRA-65" /LENGTH=97 /DNA_ID=CAMNT_0028640947 /DNA_START=88 /DNA_END=381 /DNA_ORIENTATION=+
MMPVTLLTLLLSIWYGSSAAAPRGSYFVRVDLVCMEVDWSPGNPDKIMEVFHCSGQILTSDPMSVNPTMYPYAIDPSSYGVYSAFAATVNARCGIDV